MLEVQELGQGRWHVEPHEKQTHLPAKQLQRWTSPARDGRGSRGIFGASEIRQVPGKDCGPEVDANGCCAYLLHDCFMGEAMLDGYDDDSDGNDDCEEENEDTAGSGAGGTDKWFARAIRNMWTEMESSQLIINRSNCCCCRSYQGQLCEASTPPSPHTSRRVNPYKCILNTTTRIRFWSLLGCFRRTVYDSVSLNPKNPRMPRPGKEPLKFIHAPRRRRNSRGTGALWAWRTPPCCTPLGTGRRSRRWARPAIKYPSTW